MNWLWLGALVVIVAAAPKPTATLGAPTPTRTPTVSTSPAGKSPSDTEKLSFGRPIRVRPTDKVKVTGAFLVDFHSGPPGVVIEYETKYPVSNLPALTAEADDLMKFFQSDVEATGVDGAVLRASHFEGYGMFREGKGYGFVYNKNANGAWVRDQDKGR